jgi:hypothetical protein
MADLDQPFQDLRGLRIEAERPVALASPDHQVPWGTRKDNSRNPRFNEKLYKLFAGRPGPLWVLDLGCSGGGFVKDCWDDGCIAAGIEGSDYSKRFRRAEWRTIPEYLFTADITAPFQVLGEFDNGPRPVRFDVVTAWEVLEHLAEKDLPTVVSNVRRHLAPGGLWIVSISPNEDIVQGVRLHQTIQPASWWIDRFHDLGLFQLPGHVRFFNTQFVRGPKYGAPRSFHLVLTDDPSRAPVLPRESPWIRCYDRWLGSLPHQWLRRLILGR